MVLAIYAGETRRPSCFQDDWDELCDACCGAEVECSLLAGSEGRDHNNPECRFILAAVSNVSIVSMVEGGLA